MKTVAAYIRVSTDDQIEYSPASQLDKIQQYAKAHDMILPKEYIFVDDGISGRNTAKRPEFNRMIGIAKTNPKPFDAILLWKFSRFARNREDSIVYKSMLRKQLKIDVISISEDVGDDKMSILIEALIEAMDEYYSINLAEEVKRGMTEKASRGEPLSVAPYGYKMVDSKLVIDEKTAPIVREMFERYADGVPCRTLAIDLTQRGYRTTRGNNFENRTVEYILQNPVYIGKIRWNPSGRTRRNYDDENIMIVDGQHEPLVSDELFYNVQKMIAQNKKYYSKYARRSPVVHDFMLRGLVRCSNCGSTLVMGVGGKSLQCHKYSHGSCHVSHSITLSKINNSVIKYMHDILGQRDLNVVKRSLKYTVTPFDYESRIKKLELKRKRIKDAYEDGVYTIEEYKSSIEKLNIELQAIDAEKAREIKPEEAFEKIKKKAKEILPALEDPTVEEGVKNSLLRQVVDYITFNRTTGSLDFTLIS